MMRKYNLLLCFLLSFWLANAQTFQKTYGGASTEGGQHFIKTSDGGTAIIGFTQSFGAGNWDVYLIKTDVLGNVQWSKTYGGSAQDRGFSVQQYPDGGFLLGCETFSFGAAAQDGLLIRTDKFGNAIWSKRFGGGGNEYARVTRLTPQKEIIIASYTTSFGSTDFLLSKLDSSGNFLWTKTYNALATEFGHYLEILPCGDLLVVGYASTGNNDVMLIRTDPNGVLKWAKKYAGTSIDIGQNVKGLELCCSSDHSFLIAAHTTSFGSVGEDMLVLKVDTMGDLKWAKKYGGNGNERAHTIQPLPGGDILVFGITNSFGNGAYDLFLVKTDDTGNVIWANTYGSTGTETQLSLDDKLLISGNSIELLGQTNSIGAGSDDIYYVKADALGSSGCFEKSITSLNSSTPTPAVTSPTVNETTRFMGINNVSLVVSTPASTSFTYCQTPPIDDSFHYRTAQSGNWHNLNTWQASIDSINFFPAPAIPNYNKQSITIQSGHTVTLTSSETVDELTINGKLVYGNFSGSILTINDGAGVDLTLNGQFEDLAPSNVVWSGASTWQMGSSGTLLKTRSTSSNNWRDHYENGIQNIPQTAYWILRKTGTDNPSVSSTGGMYYPNLIIENASGSSWVTSVGSSFTGSSDYPRVKGNLDIGGDGENVISVDFLDDNTNSTPVFVGGNMLVRAGCNVRNFGTGFEIQGDLTVDGSITYGTENERKLVFSGGNTQSISGSGTINIFTLKVNKSANHLHLNKNISIDNELILANRNVVTSGAYILTVNTNAFVSGASTNSFVDGKVKKIGNSAFTFPTGKNGNYQPISISAPSNVTDAFMAEYFDSQQPFGSALENSLDAISSCEYWSLTREAGSSDVSVTLGWNSNSCINSPNIADYRVAGWNGSAWASFGNSSPTGNSSFGAISTDAAVSSFAAFTNAVKYNIPATKLTDEFCGAIGLGFQDTIYADVVDGFTTYEFGMENQDLSFYQTYLSQSNALPLANVLGLVDETSYVVTVRPYNGVVFGDYGIRCQIHIDTTMTILPCGMDLYIDSFLKAEPFNQEILNAQIQQVIDYLNQQDSGASFRISGCQESYTIPIVIHMKYNPPVGDPNYISDQQVLDVVNKLNEAFNGGTNPNPQFGPNVCIQFCLAKKTGSGSSDWSTYGSTLPGVTRGFQGVFDYKKYLNISVVDYIPNANGTAAYPPGANSSDGIRIRNSAFGDQSKTLIHEAGHYLGVLHTFGFTNSAGCPNSDCAISGTEAYYDYICDTDRQEFPVFGCPASSVSCGAPLTGNNINNHMNYTSNSCRFLFTEGQAKYMRAVMNTNPVRKFQASMYNLIQTGVAEPNGCVEVGLSSDFVADYTVRCIGTPVTFSGATTSYDTFKFTGTNGTSSFDSGELSGIPIYTHQFNNLADIGEWTVTLFVSNTTTAPVGSSSTTIGKCVNIVNCAPINNYNSHWYMHRDRSIDFSTGIGMLGGEGNHDLFPSCSISDEFGSFLFHSNGDEVWNSNHVKITPSNTIPANYERRGDVQGTVGFRNPANQSQYFIFSTERCTETSTLEYYVYDVTQYTGTKQGKVVEYGALPPPNPIITGHISAIPSCNGSDYWVLTHSMDINNSDKFYVYKVTSLGLQPPVISDGFSVSSYLNCGTGNSGGHIQVTKDGKLVAVTSYENKICYLYSFDKESGQLFYLTEIDNLSSGVPEFSPSGQFLYLNVFPGGFRQYDLSSIYNCEIQLESFPVYPGSEVGASYICELGPDDRIYINSTGGLVSIILYPDKENSQISPENCGYLFEFGKYEPFNFQNYPVFFPNVINATSDPLPVDFYWSAKNCTQVCFTNLSCGSSFNWDFGDGNSSIEQNPTHTYLSPGSYTVTFTLDGESISHQVDIVIPSPPEIYGDRPACLNSFVNYGTNYPEMSHQWSLSGAGVVNGATDQINFQTQWNSLVGGQILVTVTDANGCTNSNALNVTVHDSPVISNLSTIGDFCNTECGGSSSVVVSGGTSPYSLFWSDGQTTPTATGLCAGSYIVEVLDANQCMISGLARVNSGIYIPIVINTNYQLAINCDYGAGWSVTSTVSGGYSPYTYLWSNNATTKDISNLSTGTYTLSVTDAKGCIESQTVSITGPSEISITSLTTNVLCNGGSNGIINSTVSGGTTPFTYLWSNDASTEDITNLTAGVYTLTLTDGNGCTKTHSVTLTQPSEITITSSTNAALCFGSSNGSADVSVSGGTSPYTFLWSNNASTEDISNLSAGSYTLTVTDNNGCTKTHTVAITQPTQLTAQPILVSNPSCYAGYGSSGLFVQGGTNPYSFLWSTGQTTIPGTGLVAGTHFVTVTDINGCSTTTSVKIKEPSPITVTLSSQNLTCFKSNDGSATANVSGGTSPYYYLWSNNGTTATITDLIANTYSVTVTDNNGCTNTSSVVISQPGVIAYASNSTNVSCFGGSEGTASIKGISGGTTPYTFLWSNDATTEDISNLSAGVYTLTLTDDNGCSKTHSVTLTQPSEIIITSAVANALCFGSSNGSANISVSGEASSYSYAWSNNATTQDISNLSAGSYTLTVTDANFCTKTHTVTITQPSAITNSISTFKATCFGGNGSATLNPSSGTPSYNFNWSNGFMGQTLNAVAGIYGFTITDANACSMVSSVKISQPQDIIFTPSSINVSCFGGSNGSASITGVSGGTSPYTYSWSNNAITNSISNLIVGTYTVTITDDNGCTKTQSFTITQPVAISITQTKMIASCFGSSDGTINVTVEGGTSPYGYSWSNSSTIEDPTGLSLGTYTLTVTDANGCTKTTLLKIGQPADITFSTQSQNVSCYGRSDGTAQVSGVSGGTVPYDYEWSNNASTPSIAGLSPGTYTVTISDGNSCTKVSTFVITQPLSPLALGTSVTQPTCSYNTGSVAAIAQGGTSPYTYLWSNNTQTTSTITGLTSESVTVTVTDANSCMAMASATITNPPSFSVVASSTPVSCFGGNDGKASLSLSGATPPYSFNWSNGVMGSPSLQSLTSGTYAVTVTDSKACTTSASVFINQPSPLNASIVSTNVTCFGLNNGSLSALATGGNFQYSYQWNVGSSAPILTNRAPGVYTVTVTDAKGCTSVASATITQPSMLQTSAVASGNLCSTVNEGRVNANTFGGTTPYAYSWSNGAMGTSSISNLASGTYTVTTTDANNCTTTASAQVSLLTASLQPASSDLLCIGGSIGVCASYSGNYGASVTYSWTVQYQSNSSQNYTASGQCIDIEAKERGITAKLTLTSLAGCTLNFTEQYPVFYANITPTAATICEGESVQLNSNGYFATSYSWSPGDGLNSTTIPNPIATPTVTTTTTYTLTTGNGACTATDNVVITVNPLPQLTTVPTMLSCLGGSDGEIDLTVSGAPTPYTYTWNNGNTTQDLQNLSEGSFSVIVTSSNGCSSESAAATNISYPGVGNLIQRTFGLNNYKDEGRAIMFNGTDGYLIGGLGGSNFSNNTSGNLFNINQTGENVLPNSGWGYNATILDFAKFSNGDFAICGVFQSQGYIARINGTDGSLIWQKQISNVDRVEKIKVLANPSYLDYVAAAGNRGTNFELNNTTAEGVAIVLSGTGTTKHVVRINYPTDPQYPISKGSNLSIVQELSGGKILFAGQMKIFHSSLSFPSIHDVGILYSIIDLDPAQTSQPAVKKVYRMGTPGATYVYDAVVFGDYLYMCGKRYRASYDDNYDQNPYSPYVVRINLTNGLIDDNNTGIVDHNESIYYDIKGSFYDIKKLADGSGFLLSGEAITSQSTDALMIKVDNNFDPEVSYLYGGYSSDEGFYDAIETPTGYAFVGRQNSLINKQNNTYLVGTDKCGHSTCNEQGREINKVLSVLPVNVYNSSFGVSPSSAPPSASTISPPTIELTAVEANIEANRKLPCDMFCRIDKPEIFVGGELVEEGCTVVICEGTELTFETNIVNSLYTYDWRIGPNSIAVNFSNDDYTISYTFPYKHFRRALGLTISKKDENGDVLCQVTNYIYVYTLTQEEGENPVYGDDGLTPVCGNPPWITCQNISAMAAICQPSGTGNNEFVNEEESISQNKTWVNEIHYVKGKLTIEEGKTLNVVNSTLIMDYGSSIVVEKGANIHLQDSEVKGCGGAMSWEGIKAKGNSGLNQTSQEQSLIRLRKSEIKDAMIAINAGDEIPGFGGAIIDIDQQSKLTDNLIGIYVSEYIERQVLSGIRDLRIENVSINTLPTYGIVAEKTFGLELKEVIFSNLTVGAHMIEPKDLVIMQSQFSEVKKAARIDSPENLIFEANTIQNGDKGVLVHGARSSFKIEQNRMENTKEAILLNDVETLSDKPSNIEENTVENANIPLKMDGSNLEFLSIRCNRFNNYLDYGLYSDNTQISNQGSQGEGAGNIFLSASSQAYSHINHNGPSFSYFIDPEDTVIFSDPLVYSSTVLVETAGNNSLCRPSNGAGRNSRKHSSGDKKINPVLRLYPSINNGNFTLVVFDSPEEQATLIVRTMSGNEVLRTRINPSSYTDIYLNNSNVGMYMVELLFENDGTILRDRIILKQ